MLRSIGGHKLRPVFCRDSHPHLIAERTEFVPGEQPVSCVGTGVTGRMGWALGNLSGMKGEGLSEAIVCCFGMIMDGRLFLDMKG